MHESELNNVPLLLTPSCHPTESLNVLVFVHSKTKNPKLAPGAPYYKGL